MTDRSFEQADFREQWDESAVAPNSGPVPPHGVERAGPDPSAARRPRLMFQRQWIGVNVAGHYVSLRGPSHRPLFSERNRIKTRVLPLFNGWRIVVRRWQGA